MLLPLLLIPARAIVLVCPNVIAVAIVAGKCKVVWFALLLLVIATMTDMVAIATNAIDNDGIPNTKTMLWSHAN